MEEWSLVIGPAVTLKEVSQPEFLLSLAAMPSGACETGMPYVVVEVCPPLHKVDTGGSLTGHFI